MTEPPFPAAPLMIDAAIVLEPFGANDRQWGARLADMEPWRTLGATADGLRRHLVRPDPALARYRILHEANEAGVICIRHPWLAGPFVELLAILEPFRRQGLGRAVMGGILARAATTSRNLWVTVSDGNPVALTFYRQLGFVELARIPGLLQPGHDDILLRRHPLPGAPD
ncbi:MAG: GNAT family N-acetyltransferase [Magnetococcales bacterium]|nr:GNAT family N-acetyltransferase [Magnetococcales bacterium]